jgi:HK97 family phage prohead protease
MGSKRGTALQWLSPPDFQDLVAKHPTATRNVGVKKQYIFDEAKAISDAERIIRFTITNGNVDRDRDIVNPGGLKTDNYLKNPVVLFGHDYSSLPVAKTNALRTDGNKWVADAQFATHDLYPFADTVFRMVKGGFLNASSIGFRPMEFAINEERHGIDFLSIELLEYSIVPIPAHPEALVEARSMGIDIQPLKDWATRVLDEWGQDGALYIPREQAEAIVKIGHAMITVPALPEPEKAADPEMVIETPAPDIIDIQSADGLQDPATGDLVLKDIPTDGDAVAKRGRVLSAANEGKLRQAAAMIADVVSQVAETPNSPSSGEPGELEIDNDAIAIIANKAEEGGLSIEDAEPLELTDDAPGSDGTLAITIDHDTLQRAVVETLRQSTASLGSLIERSVESAVRRARGKVD